MKITTRLFLKPRIAGISLFVLVANSVIAQKQPKPAFYKSVSFITENDTYLLRGSDRYYSNGLFLQYRTAQIKKGKKNIKQIELGQMLFTPKRKFDENDLRFYSTYPVNTIDRPYCGYLHLKYSNARFISKSKMYQWGITGGTIGKASGAEQTQKLVHRIAGLYIPFGWENQLKHDFLLNVQASYRQELLNKKAGGSQIKIIPAGTVNLGNANTSAQLLCSFAFGVMNDFENTTLLNAGIGNDDASLKKYELFVYFQPGLTFQVYDATIEKNPFVKNDAAVNKPLPVRYQHKIAMAYAKKRISVDIGYMFQTKELKIQQLNHRYASVQFAYKFR